MYKHPDEGFDADYDPHDPYDHNFIVYLTVGVTGVLVGHVKEIPAIIVQSDTEDGVKDEVTKSINLYWHIFPEEHDKMFPKHPTATKEKPLTQDNMKYRTIEVTIPQI